MRTTIKSRMSSKFGPIRPQSAELAALERLENPIDLYLENVVSTLVVSIIIDASLILHVTRTTIKTFG